ncbi:MAG: ACP S-malonyltransferase [Acidimicrobiales bacterium]|nr:ACP S-malonyltransferase [Acidimicrobiales bacterium]
MIAFTYSGQGSQQPGMGSPWLNHPSWELVDEASDAAGRDVAHLLLAADSGELRATRNAQLATFVISMVILDAVERLGIDAAGHAGHSLGEYSALTAAGALEFADAVSLVVERGEAMEIAVVQPPGTMAAVLGLEDAGGEEACAAVGGDVWVANYNAPGQVVIAGSPAAVVAAGEEAKKLGAKRVTKLEVAGAFHTPYMATARDRLSEAVDGVEIRPPEGIVVANVDATAHKNPATWRALMNAQLCSPVRWSQSLETLSAAGFNTFIELGPGNVLTGLVKRTLKSATRLTVNTPTHLDSLLDRLAGTTESTANDSRLVEGEHLFATDRMVVSPASGVFTPVANVSSGHIVKPGELLGHVGITEVHSPFAGEFMGWLALETERVTSSQPVAWLRTK